MRNRSRLIWMIMVALIACVGVFFVGDYAQAANNKSNITNKTGYTINQDDFRKIMIKKLGTPYYKMDCSAYVKWVVKHMGSNRLTENSIKIISVTNGRTSYDWGNKGAIKVTYRPAVYNKKKEKWGWGKKRKVALNTNITKWTSFTNTMYKRQSKKLKIGDTLLYQNHVALYFGKFDSAKKVIQYLKKQCGMKKITKSKTAMGLTCYKYKGKIILIDYPECGKYWRIHSTTSHGVIIDNDLSFHNGRYGGKWYGRIHFVDTTK